MAKPDISEYNNIFLLISDKLSCTVSDWCKSQGLTYLSVPEFVAAGEHTHLGLRYRFMVMHQYGEDIEKKFTSVGRRFGMKTVCHLALRLVRV